MPVLWPIAKFLLKLFIPRIPDIVSTMTNMKKQQDATSTKQEASNDKQWVEVERELASQLQLLTTLTQQVASLHITLRRTLVISIIAFSLAMLSLILSLFQ